MNQQENPLISVIIPIYNKEKYLECCLESVISQTYKKLEIVLVDDGSTDDSQKICEQYAKEDLRIKVFHKSNGGVSEARNFGIEHSKGQYITFVDSDDKVTEDYVEFLWKLIENGKYNMSVCSLYIYFGSNNHIVAQGNGQREILSSKQCIERMCYDNEVVACVCAKMMHRDLFHNIKFPIGKLFEDIGTSYRLFEENMEIACGFSPKYYYCIRPNSIVTSSFNMKKLDMLEMTDQMAAYVNEKYPDLKVATIRRQVYARFSTLNQMAQIADMDDIKHEMILFIRSHAKEIMQNKKAPKRDKAAIVCLGIGYWFYRWVWSVYIKMQRG